MPESLTPIQLEALMALRDALAPNRIVLIGAAALRLQMPRLPRATNDVDIVVVAEARLVPERLAQTGWQRTDTPHRWKRDRAIADVMPISDASLRAGFIPFKDTERTMSLIGFDLVVGHATSRRLSAELEIEVASLPTLLVLKAVAWLERPSERLKDLGDIAFILQNRLSDDDELRWSDGHPVGTSGLAFEDQSPFFVGCEVAAIIREPHRAELHRLIGKLLDDTGVVAMQMAREAGLGGDDAYERARRIIALFSEGLKVARET